MLHGNDCSAAWVSALSNTGSRPEPRKHVACSARAIGWSRLANYRCNLQNRAREWKSDAGAEELRQGSLVSGVRMYPPGWSRKINMVFPQRDGDDERRQRHYWFHLPR
jgi:hypothetical protein